MRPPESAVSTVVVSVNETTAVMMQSIYKYQQHN